MQLPSRLISVSKLRSIPPTSYLANTHFVTKGLNLLFGQSGSYKTFYMLDKALWISQEVPVVYIAAEGITGMARRVTSWEQHYGLKADRLKFVAGEVDLRSDEDTKFLMADISQNHKGTGLVVFDTYARCIPGGDENAAKDTGLVIRQCAKIQRDLETAVSLIHHENRAGSGERGSGALRGAADVIIRMFNHDGLITVECDKVKDDAPWVTEEYRFLSVANSGVLVAAQEVESTGDATPQQIRILQVLALDVFVTSGATSRQLSDTLTIPYRTLFRVLSELKSNCQVVQDTKGDPYRITDFGKAALCRALPRPALPANVVEMQRFQ